MSFHNTFDGAQYVAEIDEIAKENKLYLKVGTDFGEYLNLVSRYRPEQGLGLPFDPEYTRLSHENAFWIVGWNENSELVHTQALRLIDLSGLSLSSYMAEHFLDFPPTGLDLDFNRSRYNPGPRAKQIQGTVCYHGEFWLSGAYRNTGLSCILARFALASAQLRWAPDYVIGFMPRPLAFKGLAEREGYMHSEPGCLYWHRADTGKDLEGFMVWMGREDIRHLMTIPLSGLVRERVLAPQRDDAA